jgi:hypothetical protein
METLIRYAAFEGATDKTIGIVVPNYSEAKQFMKGLIFVFHEIPKWCGPVIEKVTTREIIFNGNTRYIMLYDATCARGRTLDAVWASSKMTPEQLSPHCFNILQVGTYNTFKDE